MRRVAGRLSYVAHPSSQTCNTTSPTRIGLAVAKKRATAAELSWVSIAAVSVNRSYVVDYAVTFIQS